MFCFHLSTWKNDVAIYKDKKDGVEQFQDKGRFGVWVWLFGDAHHIQPALIASLEFSEGTQANDLYLEVVDIDEGRITCLENEYR